MDLVTHWPGECSATLLDATIRFPHADRYTTAHKVCGVAAALGAEDKLKHYVASVWTVPLETNGRVVVAGHEAFH